MNFRNGFAVILLVAISFIVIYFLPSASFTSPDDAALTDKHASLMQSSILPLRSPAEENAPAESAVNFVSSSSSSSSSSIKEFQFPSYSSTSLELSYFPNLGSQISTTSISLFAADHLPHSAGKLLFQTAYQKISCGAMMTNFCVWKGQPRYFRAGKKYFSSTGATKCCNEGEAKFRFHSVMYDPIEIDSVSTKNDNQNQIHNNFPAPYRPNTIFIAPMCWEQYGYHLFLCLLNTWSLMTKLKFASHENVGIAPKVKIGLLKSWSGENLLGRTTDWWDGFRREEVISEKNNTFTNNAKNVTNQKKTKSIFWAWWSVVADHPSDVVDLASVAPSCFPFGIVAGKIDVITPGMQQQFRLFILRRLGILDELEANKIKNMNNNNNNSNNNTIRVTIIDRQKNFKLLNRDQIAEQFQEYYLQQNSTASKNEKHPQVISRVVIFENLPSLREQMRIAASTDVMVGMHGNGLTWSAFLNPGTSALVELWPSYIYNGNYAHFAGRGNIRKWNVVVGSGGSTASSCPSSKRCNAEIRIHNEIVKEVLDFVVATKIEKSFVYRGDEEYLKTQAQYGAEKKMKKKSSP